MCTVRSACWVHIMPSPKGSVRCAQLSIQVAGYAPAQRQGSALHPRWMSVTPVPEIQPTKSGNWARRGEFENSRSAHAGIVRRRRQDFCERFLSDNRPLRGFRRAEIVSIR